MAYVTAAEFIALLDRTLADDGDRISVEAHGELGMARRLRIPTGPWDAVDLDDLRDLELVVADSVDLRGRELHRPIFVYGVRFRGRVDLRDVTVHGSVDLTACVFDEELRLDDSDIEGSLRLSRISAERLSMNGIVVRGRLDLAGCQTSRPITLFDASVDGFVDLRSVDSSEVRMKGAHVRSDLRIGCAPESGTGPSQLRVVDASNTRIDGRVVVLGCGQGQPRPMANVRQPLTAAQCEDDFRWPAMESNGLVDLNLILTAATIGGSLQILPFHGQTAQDDFSRSRYLPSVVEKTTVVWPMLNQLDLSSASVSGDVLLCGAMVRGCLNAGGAHIGGHLRLIPGHIDVWTDDGKRDIWCRQTVVRTWNEMAAAIDLKAARIGGELELAGVQVEGTLDMSNAALGSFAMLHGYRVATVDVQGHDVVVPTRIEGHFKLYLAELASAVELEGVQIAGNLSLWSARTLAYIRLGTFLNWRCSVGGDIDAHSAKLRQLELYGARVQGRVRLNGCDLLHFVAEPGVLRVPTARTKPFDPEEPLAQWTTDDAIVFSEVGQFLMRNGKIAGDLQLGYLQLTGREVDGYRGLVIEDSQIGGSLLMFHERAILKEFKHRDESYADARARCPVDYRNFSATVIGGISLKRSRIGAGINMSGVKVEGCIDLEDCHFSGDLRFGAVRRQDEHSQPLAPRTGENDWFSLWNFAVCEALNLRMVKCTNDVDLTGLVVVRASGREMTTGSIDGRYAQVDGDLLCYDEKDMPAYSRVQGQLDLSYARIVHLVVSACVFNPAERGLRCGLVLERASIGKLDVRQARRLQDANGKTFMPQESQAYPLPIKLTDMKVEVWEVEGTADQGNAEEARYIHLLANDTPLSRSVYRTLEDSLRKSGADEHADALYRAMRRREWAEARDRARYQIEGDSAGPIAITRHGLWWLFHSIKDFSFRVFLQYGTSPVSLLVFVVGLCLVALPAYRTAENFEASLAYLAVPSDHFSPGEMPPVYNAAPKEWNWPDALQVALKNHVPIVPLQVRDDWQPRDQGTTTWSLNNGSCTDTVPTTILTLCLGWAPEDLFNFLQLMNWICWPILLTFSIRRLLRQS